MCRLTDSLRWQSVNILSTWKSAGGQPRKLVTSLCSEIPNLYSTDLRNCNQQINWTVFSLLPFRGLIFCLTLYNNGWKVSHCREKAWKLSWTRLYVAESRLRLNYCKNLCIWQWWINIDRAAYWTAYWRRLASKNRRMLLNSIPAAKVGGK